MLSFSTGQVWNYRQFITTSLQWRHNGRDSVPNHQPHHCLLNRLFRRRSKKTSKPRVTGLCAGNSPGTGEFPAQMASNAENVPIWWRHHGVSIRVSITSLSVWDNSSSVQARTTKFGQKMRITLVKISSNAAMKAFNLHLFWNIFPNAPQGGFSR